MKTGKVGEPGRLASCIPGSLRNRLLGLHVTPSGTVGAVDKGAAATAAIGAAGIAVSVGMDAAGPCDA